MLRSANIVLDLTLTASPSPVVIGGTTVNSLTYNGSLPGPIAEYRCQIPANHPPGVFWYHPHHHGMAARQVLGGSMMRFTIDGRAFDAARIDQSVAADAIEEWTIVNTSPMDHPFHLHVWPMQVIDIGSTPVEAPTWQDVVNVPDHSRSRVRIAFEDFTGTALSLSHPRSRGRRDDGRHLCELTRDTPVRIVCVALSQWIRRPEVATVTLDRRPPRNN
jgi:FtsP/CotA-like multicopper oxidase with cupredoxin domain